MDQSLSVLSQRPAYLPAIAGMVSPLAANISVGFPRISIKQSIFRIVTGDTETPLQDRHLDVVIVAAKEQISKTFYLKQWQPGDAEAPDCSSSDGIAPDAGVPMPQAHSCAQCPQNQWGSKVSALGKQIKACSDTKKIVIVPAHQPESDLCLLSIPAASLKPLAQYGQMLAQHGTPATAVITRVEFDLTVDYPKLKFTAISWLDQGTATRMDERGVEPMVSTILGAVSRPAAAPAPVYQAPFQPAAAQPVYHAPAPLYQAAPAPQAQVYQAAEPNLVPFQPAPVYQAPAATEQRPLPVQQLQPSAPTAAQTASAFGATPVSTAPVTPPPLNGGEVMPQTAPVGSSLADAVAGVLSAFDDE